MVRSDTWEQDFLNKAGKIKAVFFDIDGTLYSHTTLSVPPGTRQALGQLRERGIRVVLASGRHAMELEIIPPDLAFDGYILLNGLMCLDEDRKLFYGQPLPKRARRSLVSLFDSRDYPVVLIGENRLMMNYRNEDTRRVSVSLAFAGLAETIPDEEPIYMGTIVATRDQDEEITNRLDGLRLTRWNDYGADLIPEDVSKVTGIRQYMKKFDLHPEEIMAFGDEENDMEMLTFAGIGVAMGNSGHHVQQVADYVTDEIDRDGVRTALKRFGLIS